MRKILYIAIAIVILYGAWYFLSPLFIDREVNEALPSPEEFAKMSDEQKQEAELRLLEEAGKAGDKEVLETMPEQSEPLVLKSGVFTDADAFHKGSGTANIYSLSDSSTLLRLQDFSVTNGPDLHVLLSKHKNPQNRDDLREFEYVDLGELKGNKGDQNYSTDSIDNLDEFQSVVIYCAPFHVIFSTATLQ